MEESIAEWKTSERVFFICTYIMVISEFIVIEWYNEEDTRPVYNTTRTDSALIVQSNNDRGVLALTAKNNVTGTQNNMYMIGLWFYGFVGALPLCDWIREIRSSSRSNMAIKGTVCEDRCFWHF